MDPVAELCALLARERLLLELLVFKLTSLGHLLASGDPRFLGWAAEEVERAVDAVRVCELDRAVHVQAVAGRLSGAPATDESALLLRLGAALGPPWDEQLAQHQHALQALASEVADGLQTTRRLAEVGSSAVTALVDRVGVPDPRAGDPAPALLTYGPGSTSSWSTAAPRLRTSL